MKQAKFLTSLQPKVRRGLYGRREALQEIDGALEWLARYPSQDYGPAEIARLKAARAQLEAGKPGRGR